MTGQVQLGDRFGHLRPVSGMEGVASPKAYPAEVVYVHPARDWFTVEFDMPGGKCRESFFTGLRSHFAEPTLPEKKEKSKARLPNQPKEPKKSRYKPVEHDRRHDPRPKQKLRDLIGQTFGALTVIAPASKQGGRNRWTCRCVCGRVTDVVQDNLLYGNSKSCGCRRGRPKNPI